MSNDLSEIAHQAMIEKGFEPNFSNQIIDEVNSLKKPTAIRSPSLRDLRDKHWISIDNDDTKDIDQLTFVEKTEDGIDKLYVAIADVEILVKKGSAIDARAAYNTTSVYTPTRVFPMLPEKLSTGLTSLNENEDRYAVVVELNVGKEGDHALVDLYPSLVRNQAKLAYNSIADWLEKKSPTLNQSPTTLEQLKQQDELAQRIKKFRYRQGSLWFNRVEFEPIIVDGKPQNLRATTHNRANSLIENFMIAANTVVTKFFLQNNLPVMKRIVRVPKRWNRIVEIAHNLGETLPSEPDAKELRDFLQKRKSAAPDQYSELSLLIIKLIGRGEYVVAIPGKSSPGHFDLAIQDYAHTTAPNRRFPDLIMQRLFKSHFNSEPLPYQVDELISIAQHCTQKEDDANKVERQTRKSAAAMLLAPQIGQEFDAIIIGAGEKGTWVRLKTIPVEGKLIEGFRDVDVGDHLKVKLIDVDIPKGHIDFVRIF